MSNLIAKLFKRRWMLRSIFSTIYFNFKLLPARHALKLPIILYKPKFRGLKGKIIINGPIKFGMIKLGQYTVSIYPNTGIMIQNSGTIEFNGSCTIGGNSAISVGKTGHLVFGDDIMANSTIKIACYHKIKISDHCRLGWENMIMDTDFHALTHQGGCKTKGYAPVELGEHCWIGTGCLLLKGTFLPPYTIVQARTVISKKMDIPTHCVVGADTTVKVKAQEIYRNLEDDRIDYPSSTK